MGFCSHLVFISFLSNHTRHSHSSHIFIVSSRPLQEPTKWQCSQSPNTDRQVKADLHQPEEIEELNIAFCEELITVTDGLQFKE